MIARWLLPGLLAALLAVGGWGWWQHRRAVALEARADAAEALVQGYAEAAKMRAVQDAQQAALRADAAALDRDLETMEGGDAPLSDYLSGAAGKLWP